MSNSCESEKANKICVILHRGGRRRAAYLFDTAFIMLMVFAALYIAARARQQSRASSLLTSSAASLAVFAIYRIVDGELLKRKTRKLRLKARNEAAKRKLLLAPEKALDMIEKSDSVRVFPNIDTITADELRGVIGRAESPLTVASFAKPTEMAKELLDALDNVRLVSPLELIEKTAEELVPVTENDIDRELIIKYGRLIRKPALPSGLFRITKERAGKYAAVGSGLMLLSLFMRYSIWFRLMGSISLSLAAAFFAFDTIKKAEANGRSGG